MLTSGPTPYCLCKPYSCRACPGKPQTYRPNDSSEAHLSNPKPGHTTGGSGRGARQNGRAGSGRIGCQKSCSANKNKLRALSKGSQKRRLSVSPEARTGEISRTRGALHSWMRTGCKLIHRRLCQVRMPLHLLVQARTKEFLCKPAEEQNQRLTRGSSAVHPWFISGTKSALRSWLLTSVPTPFCLCKPFSCKACPGKQTKSYLNGWGNKTCG